MILGGYGVEGKRGERPDGYTFDCRNKTLTKSVVAEFKFLSENNQSQAVR